MYADKMTKSMQLTIDETDRRRVKQIAYNTANGITPTQINKKISNALDTSPINSYHYDNTVDKAAEENEVYLTKKELATHIREVQKQMEKAAMELDFVAAARLRDKIKSLRDKL
jgi:excinuclease ABC subunit B